MRRMIIINMYTEILSISTVSVYQYSDNVETTQNSSSNVVQIFPKK